jgi:N-hydroxyarylamine O-acetyltransferase
MGNFQFDIGTYLSRIGLTAQPSVDDDGLRQLHESQFFAIPFENFDIQLGRGIELEPAALFQKLVVRARGGYCFELNGLMLLALRALGFQARPLLARVHLQSPPSGRTHQLNLVDIEGRPWIIDVGFGAGGLRGPMPLEIGRTKEGPGWAFRLERREPWGVLMQTREDDQWKDSYSFDMAHVTDADISVSNHYTSTSHASHFTQSRVASSPRPNGRVSLRNFTLTEIEHGVKKTWEISSGRAYLDALAEVFGIELDADYGDLRPVTET